MIKIKILKTASTKISLAFPFKIKMSAKKNKPPKLDLQSEDLKRDEMAEKQKNNSNVPSVKDVDKLGNLKPPLSPLTKKWFRKQFGIRKDIKQLEVGGNVKSLGTTSFQNNHRRSSSLPDLASMLDAASLKKHGSFISRTRPGSVRLGATGKEPILSQ